MAAAFDPRSCVPSPTPTAAAFTAPVAHPSTHGPTPPFETEGSPRATDEPRKELEVESEDLDVKEEKPGVAAGSGSDELAQAAHVAHDLSRGKDAEIEFPDGGLRAWLVVAGALHLTFCTFGFTNAWGVFQAYYTSINLSGQTPSTIAWIGSGQYCLIFLPSVIVGRWLDVGIYRLPTTIASVLYVLAVFLTAQCTEFWQCFLAQGVLLGLSAGVMFGPTLAVCGHWFSKRRGIAYGIIACGSSLGGTVFPIMVRHLIPKVGFPWTLRICGFIILYCITFAWFTVRPRLPPKRVSGGMFNFRAFTNPVFSLYVAGCWLVLLGLYTPLTYLDVDGTALGLGEFSSYLIAIANACSLAGRLIPGFLADMYGPVNILIPSTYLSGILIFVWPSCRSKGSLVAFAALIGATTGCFVSLFSPGVAQLGETADLGRRMGMLTTTIAFSSLIGPPISGAILTATSSYLSVASFAGTTVLVGASLLVLARFLLLKGWKGRM